MQYGTPRWGGSHSPCRSPDAASAVFPAFTPRTKKACMWHQSCSGPANAARAESNQGISSLLLRQTTESSPQSTRRGRLQTIYTGGSSVSLELDTTIAHPLPLRGPCLFTLSHGSSIASPLSSTCCCFSCHTHLPPAPSARVRRHWPATCMRPPFWACAICGANQTKHS